MLIDEQNDGTPLLAPGQHNDARLGSSGLLKWCYGGFSACCRAICNRMTISNWGRVLQSVGVLGVALTRLFYDSTLQRQNDGDFIVADATQCLVSTTASASFIAVFFLGKGLQTIGLRHELQRHGALSPSSRKLYKYNEWTMLLSSAIVYSCSIWESAQYACVNDNGYDGYQSEKPQPLYTSALFGLGAFFALATLFVEDAQLNRERQRLLFDGASASAPSDKLPRTIQALGVGIVGSAYIVINTSTSNPDLNRLLFSLSQLLGFYLFNVGKLSQNWQSRVSLKRLGFFSTSQNRRYQVAAFGSGVTLAAGALHGLIIGIKHYDGVDFRNHQELTMALGLISAIEIYLEEALLGGKKTQAIALRQ